MSAALHMLAETWRYRKELVLPTVLLPLAMAGYALSQPPRFTATAMLQVDTAHAKSPLLQEIDKPGHGETLNRILHGQELLRDTAHDAGMQLNPAHVRLRVLNDKMLEIAYTSPQELGLEALVDALATNFIYEVLAPERLRVEQRLANAGQQLSSIKARLNSPEGAAEAPRLRLEEEALTSQYGELMGDLSAINAAFDKGAPGGLVWFAQPAEMQAASTPSAKAVRALGCGAMLGFVLGLGWMLVRRMRPRGVATQEILVNLTQLPVAGTVPDLGPVQVAGGKVQVALGHTVLNPVDFTETTRLHRTLTRNLHGSLVFTSPTGGEGTSLLALLMALKSTASGKRTLLVDLNLKNGWLTEALGHKPVAWGLEATKVKARGASRGATLAECIVPSKLADGLDVLPLPSDKPTLERLATAEGAAGLLDGLSSQYEHIMVDTTPLAAHNRHNADPVMLAAAATRTVLVVRMRNTEADMVKTAADQLVSSGAHMAGVVANNVDNPSPRVLLMHLARTLGKVAPGLAGWLRAKVIASGVE